jgi:hypothetical protein
VDVVGSLLEQKLIDLQAALFARAKKSLDEMIVVKETLADMIPLKETNVFRTGFCGERACETQLKPHTLSVRCVLAEKKNATCCICGKESQSDCMIARSY